MKVQNKVIVVTGGESESENMWKINLLVVIKKYSYAWFVT